MKRTVDALKDEVFDLLILGGGITGAGVALDSALRGYRVALIDKADFASGTSSASSKLIHGGLRYLEQANFRLVYEALHERSLLLENAPHLVHPLRFLLPFYQQARLPPWKWRTGLTLYDLLAGATNIRRSRPVRLSSLKREYPNLRTQALLGGAEYYDAQMDDARLCIEVIRTAALQGVLAANYVEALAFELAGGEIKGVRALDRIGGQEFTIKAKQVLNATGPWVDAICRMTDDATEPHLRPTKGVHLVMPDLGLNAAFLLLHPVDGRVFFVIPWHSGLRPSAGGGKTLIGTTDTAFDGNPDHLTVTLEDIEYLLKGFNHFFSSSWDQKAVLGSFVGLRPLIRAGTDSPSAISREFRIFTSPSGLVSVAGGKYTTYRHMAEVVTDAIVRRLGQRRYCRTRDFRLDGAPEQPWNQFEAAEVALLTWRHGLAAPSAHHLVNRYGRRASQVAEYLSQDPNFGKAIAPGEPDLWAEVVYQRDREMAIHPADHFLRRTRLGLSHPRLLKGSAPFGPVSLGAVK